MSEINMREIKPGLSASPVNPQSGLKKQGASAQEVSTVKESMVIPPPVQLNITIFQDAVTGIKKAQVDKRELTPDQLKNIEDTVSWEQGNVHEGLKGLAFNMCMQGLIDINEQGQICWTGGTKTFKLSGDISGKDVNENEVYGFLKRITTEAKKAGGNVSFKLPEYISREY